VMTGTAENLDIDAYWWGGELGVLLRSGRTRHLTAGQDKAPSDLPATFRQIVGSSWVAPPGSGSGVDGR
jgi:hypothetical protein